MALDVDLLDTSLLMVRGRVCFGNTANGSIQQVNDAAATANDNAAVIEYTALTVGRTITGPSSPKPGQVILIKNASAGAFALTFQPAAGTGNIDGAANKAVTTAAGYSFARVYFDGSNWFTC